MLLARPQELQVLYVAQDEHRVLDGKGRTEPGKGPGGLASVRGKGVGGHYRLGMPAEEGGHGREYRPCPDGDSPKRKALSYRPRGTSAPTRSLQANAPAAAEEGDDAADGTKRATLIRPHPKTISILFL